MPFSLTLQPGQMWRGDNTSTVVLSLRANPIKAVLATIALLTITHQGLAQPSDSTQSNRAPLVDWSHAMQAHHLVEAWVLRGAVDDKASSEPIEAVGVEAVCITLRWSGLTMGVGMAHRDDANPSADLVTLVRLATSRALAKVEDRLADRRTTSNETQSKILTLPEAGHHLQVDLQIAHSPTQVQLTPTENDQAIFSCFVPGYHGLRMASRGHNEKINTAWIWPANALAGNISPRSQLVRLLSDLGYKPQDLKQIAQREGPSLKRFDVIHIVRPRSKHPVVRLTRGGTLIRSTDITESSIEQMAMRLTDFLIRRQRPDGSMAGTYHPSTDRYDPITAPLPDIALATYALTTRLNDLKRNKPDHAQINRIKSAIGLGVKYLINQVSGEIPGRMSHRTHPTTQLTTDPAAVALLIMTLVESPGMAAYKTDRDRLVAKLLEYRTKDGLFRSSDNNDTTLLDYPTQSLIVAALHTLYETTRDEQLERSTAQSQQVLWRNADITILMKSLPWIAITQIPTRYSVLTSEVDANTPNMHTALTSLAAAIYREQFPATSDMDSTDLVGGFKPVIEPSNGPPEPDWRTAQALFFLTKMMKHPRSINQNDRLACLLQCGLATRFLMQLMFDEPACYYARSQDDVLGGLRETLWNNQLSIKPSAMGLLTITTFQEVLREVERTTKTPGHDMNP